MTFWTIPGQASVKGIHRLAGLEENVGVLRGAAEDGTVRRKGALAVRFHQLGGDQRPQIVVRQFFDLADLVRGAEAVEEVQEGNARLERGGLRDEGKVHHFLDGIRRQQAEARRARRHHVAVVAENREGVRGQGARRDVQHRRRQLTGDLKHVGNHQQQALRGRKGDAQRSGLKRAMQRTRSASFALHLDHVRNRTPDVGFDLRRPLIRPLSHGRRRRDGINGNYFIDAVSDAGSRLVPVNGYLASSHLFTPSCR